MLCSAFAVSFLFVGVMHGQYPKIPLPITTKDQIIKSADLESGVAVLRKAYEALHPGLYRYNTKTEMDAHFAALESKLSHDLSLQDAYLAFSIFAAQVRCGHTYPNFFNQRKAVAAALFQGQNRVPFYFRWLDRRMVVTKDFTPDHLLPRGTRVFSINGAPVEAILAQLITIARADGSNDAKRVGYLEVTGDSIFEAFDVYFPMFFPQKSAALELVTQRPGEPTPRPLSVEALTYEQRIAPIKAREEGRKGGGDILFEWKYLADGTAYLRMPTWALYESKWDWKAWLNSHLDELVEKKAPALIVDLRENEGGTDIGNELLKRLIHSDVRISSYRRFVRYRETPSELNIYLDTWDPSFKNWGTAAVELSQPWATAPPVHYFGLTKFDDDAAGDEGLHPTGTRFLGKLYVLVDANNSSATFQFAQVVKQNQLGTLVGQPTGGNQRGINGGAFFFLRLPKFGIELDLPLIATFADSTRPDAGITPDILVTPTLQDLAAGRDVELGKVDELQRKYSHRENSSARQ
jgi:C-terminal processing protease CtpA/Prc